MRSKTTVKALLATVSPAALALVGTAVDLPVIAPAMAAPASSWTGCYVGGHVGYGWGTHEVSRAQSFSFSSTAGVASGRRDFDTRGGVYGGQVGCNYQFASNWVLGVEGMFAGTNIKGDVADPVGAFGFGPNTISVKTDWLWSAVARFGATAANNQALFYGKFGVAGARNTWSNSNPVLAGMGGSENRFGWTVGGGVEWALAPQWSVFVDFSHYHFDNNGSTFSVAYSFGGCGSVGGSTCFVSDSLTSGPQTINVVKGGLNFKFGP